MKRRAAVAALVLLGLVTAVYRVDGRIQVTLSSTASCISRSA